MQENKCVTFKHIKIFLTGSAAAGKTSFRRSLLNSCFSEEYTSTDMLETKQAYIVNSACLLESKQGGKVWYELTPKNQLIHFNTLLKSQQLMEVSSCSQTVSKKDDCVQTDVPSIFANKFSKFSFLPHAWRIGKVVKLITITDTGGQPEYINLLPAIVTHSKRVSIINFLVHDMTKDLEDPVCVRYKKQGHKELESYKLNISNKDLIKMLMPVVDSSVNKEENAGSYLCLIGTHKDKSNQRTIETLNKQLTDLIGEHSDLGVKIIPTKDGNILHAIDNTSVGDKEDPMVKEIREKVEDYMQNDYKLPITWMILELMLQDIHDAEKVTYIPYQRYIDTAREATILDEEEIKESLQYFHSLGVFLFFEHVPGLCNYVIIDHQWWYDKLAVLVNIQCESICGLDYHCHKQFKKCGVIPKSKICDIVGWNDDIKVEHFMSLLVHKRIIAEFTMKGEEYYFFPYVLPYCQYYSDRHKFLLSEPLLVQFSSGFLPVGFFCSLIVHLLQTLPHNWNHQLLSNSEDTKNFRNVVTFLLPNGLFLRMQDKSHYLELQIRHYKQHYNKDTCFHYQVYNKLCKYIQEVCDDLKFKHNNLQYGFLCHDAKINDDHIAVIPSAAASLPCRLDCHRNCRNPTEIGELHKCWLEATLTDDPETNTKCGR